MKTLATLLAATLACAPCTREQRSGDAKTPAPTPAPDSGSRAAEEACVDAWLSKNHLDPYGSPEGTMYAGGTPLFNEATGERTDRLEYVYTRHPEVKEACSPGGR